MNRGLIKGDDPAMNHADETLSRAPRRDQDAENRLPRVLLGLLVICVAIELVLTAADFGLIATPRLRGLVYENAGFWPGLLRGWTPNYPGQSLLMFITYGFLHAGLVHLGVNMLTLVSLGIAIVAHVGQKRFAVIYAASLVGGALGFGLLADTLQPMVGASGALFGLAGAQVQWLYADRRARGDAIWPVVRIVLYLAGLNLVLWWAMNGHLAWQTHLGGFISGWIAARLLSPRAPGQGAT